MAVRSNILFAATKAAATADPGQKPYGKKYQYNNYKCVREIPRENINHENDNTI